MKKLFLSLILTCISIASFAQGETFVQDALNIDEVVIASFYSPPAVVTDVITIQELKANNYEQEPSNYFIKSPSVIALNDNGTEFGYGYFRIRGLANDATRLNIY